MPALHRRASATWSAQRVPQSSNSVRCSNRRNWTNHWKLIGKCMDRAGLQDDRSFGNNTYTSEPATDAAGSFCQ
jgi:hypothetical protein